VLVLLKLLLLLLQCNVQVSFLSFGQGRIPNYVFGGVGIAWER